MIDWRDVRKRMRQPKTAEQIARQKANKLLEGLAQDFTKRASVLSMFAELGDRLPPHIRLRVLDVLRDILRKVDDLIVKLEAA